jgi:hypothetical protein
MFQFSKKGTIDHKIYVSVLEKKELLTIKCKFKFLKKGTIDHEMYVLIFEKKELLAMKCVF